MKPIRFGFDLQVLAACLTVVLAALILPGPRPGANGIELGGIGMPSTCILHLTTGIDCPFCGMTRSQAALFHGHFSESADFHPLGPALGLFLIIQILYRVAKLWIIPDSMEISTVPRHVRMAPFYLMLAALTAAWFIKMGMTLAVGR